MAQHFESSFSIRNLLANNDSMNPALTPPRSDISMSPNESMSSNEENCGSRPNYTYSELITMAVRSSIEGKLTLNAIQNWISENFPYYRKDEQGWQNQIRQTLSTNTCFCKIPRAINEPGRGNYWAISPAGAHQVQQPFGGSETLTGAMVNGVPHPQVPNAVYFLTPQEVQGAHQQHAWYQYHLQQSKFLEQQLMVLQQQQIQQQYEEVYQKFVFHQQQMAFLSA
ncbi:PREDICTED: fork head domain transcription factor slp1-like [Bactrocera latifrons]|uniref:fork head domain transcription factor slp1-like n=1 Tax=Bactrocera latifrons TaxID=174628 RepID=UPI0008DDCF7F|nr:PREDICTED: fork head domain transcription factor slp1-like [Bactrocera latifrons]